MNYQRIFFVLTMLLFGFCHANAQDSTKSKPVSFSGYAEVYYNYDFNTPPVHEIPRFFNCYRRHNEVNLNLGFLKAAYNTDSTRASLAFMSGTYAHYNLTTDYPILQHVLEASIGIKILKKRNLWVDAGIMPSHIGFESAVGKDCWNLTRSMLAENSPFYESGIKLGYTTKNEKLYLAGLYLNGWQRILRPELNNTPAFGTQLTFKPNAEVIFNWSTFIGNEKDDHLAQWRYFNNFYGQFQLNNQFGLTAGFDIGAEQASKGSSDYNIWYGAILMAKASLSDKISFATRSEYYSDPHMVLIYTGTPNGFQTWGYSINLDYLISENAMWRLEGRMLRSVDEIFYINTPIIYNYFATTSLALSF